MQFILLHILRHTACNADNVVLLVTLFYVPVTIYRSILCRIISHPWSHALREKPAYINNAPMPCMHVDSFVFCMTAMNNNVLRLFIFTRSFGS